MKQIKPNYLLVASCQLFFLFMLYGSFADLDKGVVHIWTLILGITVSIIGFFWHEFEAIDRMNFPEYYKRMDEGPAEEIKRDSLEKRGPISSIEYVLLVAVIALIVFKFKDVVSRKINPNSIIIATASAAEADNPHYSPTELKNKVPFCVMSTDHLITSIIGSVLICGPLLTTNYKVIESAAPAKKTLDKLDVHSCEYLGEIKPQRGNDLGDLKQRRCSKLMDSVSNLAGKLGASHVYFEVNFVKCTKESVSGKAYRCEG